jgi:hypothetical protein
MIRRVACGAMLLAVLLPAVALARRLGTKHQHAGVVAAAVAAHDINPPQGRCARVFISTPDTNWASLDFPPKESKSCLAQAANGVTIFHFGGGKWHLVTGGSSFPRCPPKGVPKTVAHDLKIC